VLVVDDSAVVRQIMTAVLVEDRRLTVEVAADPLIAMEKMKRARPDVILLDLEMPRMDGLTFLQKIMAEDPIPVVVCSGVARQGTEMALRALDLGAVDIVTKPKIGVADFLRDSAVMLIDSIRAAAGARLRPRGLVSRAPSASPRISSSRAAGSKRSSSARAAQVIAVAASTGGPDALRSLLQALPTDVPGMVIVQHMPAAFTAAFAARLDQVCRIEVKEAAHGDRVLRGRALIAPGDRHLRLCRSRCDYTVAVAKGRLVSRHRPSADVLFRSVARAAAANAVGVLLTGMGSDGAAGLVEMKNAGATTIAQDEASCVVFGMPREAIALGAVDKGTALDAIPAAILKQSCE
jgi:two-component system chemotaxis response regulator CheB